MQVKSLPVQQVTTDIPAVQGPGQVDRVEIECGRAVLKNTSVVDGVNETTLLLGLHHRRRNTWTGKSALPLAQSKMMPI